jgi:hypothetical protein
LTGGVIIYVKANVMTLRTLGRVFAVLSVFVYFLFFVGRVYSEAYLKTLGIPPSTIKYEFFDYAYFGAQLDTIIITIIFTFIFFGIIWYFRMETNGLNKYKKIELFFAVFYLFYSVAVLIAVSIIFIFNKSAWNQPAAVVAAIMTTIIPAAFIIIILTERGLLRRIKRGRILSPLFVASMAITLIIFPYLSTSGWGAFKAYTSPYEELNLSPNTLVEISASHPLINDINWESRDNDLYVTTEELFLILKNDTNLFIKRDLGESETYIISTDDIISYSISTKESETESPTPPLLD